MGCLVRPGSGLKPGILQTTISISDPMADQQDRAPRVKLTGLWTNEMRDGKKFLSGANGSVRYSIFPNGYAEKATDPSHILYLEQVQKKQEE